MYKKKKLITYVQCNLYPLHWEKLLQKLKFKSQIKLNGGQVICLFAYVIEKKDFL